MDAKIAEVCGIAGCTQEQAKFFLESTNGDVGMAVSAFFGAFLARSSRALLCHEYAAVGKTCLLSHFVLGEKGHRPCSRV